MVRYREIADSLRDKIQAGEYPVGTKLPSISELQREYDVPALNTIRAAQQLLADEGMIETRQGIGAFVIAAEPPRELDIQAAIAQARDTLTTALIALEAKARDTVTFELMTPDNNYFVLSEALREYAERQRAYARDNPDHTATSRIEWAQTAEAALARINEVVPS